MLRSLGFRAWDLDLGFRSLVSYLRLTQKSKVTCLSRRTNYRSRLSGTEWTAETETCCNAAVACLDTQDTLAKLSEA